MEMSLVYITAGSLEEARHIGRTLVQERLAACVNIIDGMTSIYRWDGEMQEGAEVVLIAKTRAALFEVLAERVRVLHSYTTPCIVEVPLGRIDAGFVAWLAAQTEPCAT